MDPMDTTPTFTTPTASQLQDDEDMLLALAENIQPSQDTAPSMVARLVKPFLRPLLLFKTAELFLAHKTRLSWNSTNHINDIPLFMHNTRVSIRNSLEARIGVHAVYYEPERRGPIDDIWIDDVFSDVFYKATEKLKEKANLIMWDRINKFATKLLKYHGPCPIMQTVLSKLFIKAKDIVSNTCLHLMQQDRHELIGEDLIDHMMEELNSAAIDIIYSHWDQI